MELVHDARAPITSQTPDAVDLYTPLPADGIRLVRVSPAEHGAHSLLHLDMRVCSWRENPAYSALSYAWGEHTESHTVLINGRELPIRDNLWHFLRDIAQEACDWLWVDALCINQADLVERSTQVRLMTVIFRLAERTIIWIGPGTASSETAMQYVIESATISQHVELGITAPKALLDLCSRSYWTRLWVYQELVLSGRRQLACGRKLAPFESFRYLVTHCSLFYNDQELREHMQSSAAYSILTLTDLQAQRITLLTLKQDTSHLQCAEPLDMVYALLGTNPLGCDGLVPDYTVKLSDLLNTVLLMHHQQVRSPDSVEAVAQQCMDLGLVAEAEDVIRPHASADLLKSMGDGLAINSDLAAARSTFNWAIHHGHGAVLSLLVQRRPNEASVWLWRAIKDKDDATMKLLLESGAGSCEDMEHGKTASQMLTQASSEGSAEVVKLLLRQRAWLGLTSVTSSLWHDIADGLSSAAAHGHMHIVEMLLQHVVGYEPSDDRVDPIVGHGYTYRLKAVTAALLHDQEDIARNLLLNCQSRRQQKPYHTAAISNVMKTGNELLLRTLLDHGVRSEFQDCRDLIQLAIRFDDPPAMEMLLARGAHLDAQFVLDNMIFTPLTYAVYLGNLDVIEWLLTQAAKESDVRILRLGAASIGGSFASFRAKAVNKGGLWSISHHDVSQESTAAADSCLGSAINLNKLETLEDAWGKSERHPNEIYGYFPTEYHQSIWLLKWSPVWIAAKYDRTDILKLLLKSGAPIDRSTAIRMRKTNDVLPSFRISHSIGVLFVAILREGLRTVKLLLAEGSRVDRFASHYIMCIKYDRTGKYSETWHGLYVAAASENIEMARLLLEAGVAVSEAEVRVYDNRGAVTQRAHALLAASRNQDNAMLKLLRSYGAVDTSCNVEYLRSAMDPSGLWRPPFSIEEAHFTHEDELSDNHAPDRTPMHRPPYSVAFLR